MNERIMWAFGFAFFAALNFAYAVTVSGDDLPPWLYGLMGIACVCAGLHAIRRRS